MKIRNLKKVVRFRLTKVSDDMDADTQTYLKQMKLIYGLKQAHTNGDGKLTPDELSIELANLDMPHKALRMKELREQGKI